jgi:hypothetical protein
MWVENKKLTLRPVLMGVKNKNKKRQKFLGFFDPIKNGPKDKKKIAKFIALLRSFQKL